ncbi:MAG: CD225/dispanin family protein [Rhodococcus sp. (in: high G+C Gram-positive bacteria)]|uniref:CD225/dispanin family protein n=1 Tax=Rhodococcus sp. TaxID=1831 RepID=UPI003BB7CB75
MNEYPQYPPSNPDGFNPQAAPGGYGYGQYPGAPQFGPPPENNLVWGILTTVLCCLPLGIVSIIKSNQVNTLWAQGQFDAARKAAEDAKKFAIWSVVASVAVWVVIVLFYVVVFAAAMSSSY